MNVPWRTRSHSIHATLARECGMTLVEVLAAILIFTFGLLSVAKLYASLMSAHISNEQITAVQTYGNRFWAVLQASPDALGCSTTGGQSLSFDTAAQVSGAPEALQSLLNEIIAEKSPLGAPSVSIVLSALGSQEGECEAKVKVAWTSQSGAARSQTFTFQVGGL